MKARTIWIGLGALVILGLVAVLVVPGLTLPLRPAAAQSQATPEAVEVITLRAVTTVESSGTIEPQQSASLVWRTTGTVATVAVQVGDTVQTGDILMTLDPASVPANVIQAESELIAAQNALDDLRNPTALSIANAQQAVVDAQEQLEQAERDLRGLANPDLDYYADQVAQKQQALTQAQQNAEKTDIGDLARALDNAAENLATKTNQLNDARSAQEQCPGCTVVFINATGRRMSLADAEQEYNEAVNARRVAELNYQQASANNSDAVANAQEALADAQANLAAAQAGPDPLDLARQEAVVAVARARLADAQDQLEQLQNGPDADDIAAAEVRIEAAEATLESLVLRAPFGGEVLAVNLQPGDPASQSAAALVLANRTRLHVNVAVDETEVSQITPGDPVSVTVEAWPGLDLPGSVGAVQTFGETVQGLVRYTVRIDLAESDPRLYLNMTANAAIVTDVQEAALAVPLEAIQFDDRGEFVLRLRADGATERVDVLSGTTQDDYVVVTGDLQAGDKVQLAPAEPEPDGFPFGG